MPKSPLEIYQEALQKKQEQERQLEELQLGELASTETANVADGIDPIAEQSALLDQQASELQLAKKQARNDKATLDLDNDLMSDVNLAPDEKDRILTNIEKSVQSGTMGNEDKDNLKALNENPSEIAPEMVKPVATPEVGGSDRVKELLAKIEAMKAEKKPASSESDEVAALKEAQRQKRFMDGLAQMNRGIANAAAGHAGRGLTKIKLDDSFAKSFEEEGKQGIQNVKDISKLKKDQYDKNRKNKLEELNQRYKEAQISKLSQGEATGSTDPNSLDSKAAQAQAKALMGTLGIQFDPDEINKMAASTIGSKNFTAGLRKSVNALSKKKEERMTEKFGYQKNEKFEDDANKALKDMRGTDLWKSAEKSLAELPNIEALLDDAYKEGGQSLAMLGPKVARGIANEVGVLTEQDVTRYIKNPTLAGGMIDDLKKITSGQISKTSYKNLKRLMLIGKQAAEDKLDKAMDREAELFARRERITYDEARSYIDNNYAKKQVARDKRELNGQDRDAYEWATANRKDPRSTEILRKLGME